jgi:transcriptional regulator with XRE-family HTH domain
MWRVPVRARYGLTQDEVAAAIGAAEGSALGALERGVSVPDGVRRQQLNDLLDGKRWADLRGALIEGRDMPSRG